MSGAHFALPVLVGNVTVHLAKGRRWSVVEHLLLEAVCRNPQAAEDLARAASLPERMVVEALINLMRAGWVELVADEQPSLFRATAGGRANAGRDELPAVMRFIKRPVRYAVERVTGAVLRYRELDFVWAARFRSMNMHGVRVIEPSSDLPDPMQTDVLASMLNEDEEFRGVVPESSRQGDGYALITATGGKLRGLPAGAPQQLVDLLLASVEGPKGERPALPEPRHRTPRSPPTRQISLSDIEVVLGGDDHRQMLTSFIESARSMIMIHSTFVGMGECQSIINMLAAAARQRGVRVDILWGKGDRADEENTTRAACEAINARMASEGLGQFVRAHAFSTGSHSKMIVADDGRDGFVAALGSCNWLSTSFDTVEASVRLSDPLIVSDVMDAAAQMAHRVTGLNGGVAGQLAGQCINIRRRAATSQAKRCTVRLVLGPAHAKVMLAARDTADREITVGSHKLGRSARTLTLMPMAAAVKAKSVKVDAMYDELAAGMTAEQADALSREFGASGVQLRSIRRPRMHAKFLAWDDDGLLVTSQNLLSANPSDDYAEIGLLIEAPGVARSFRDRLMPTLHLQ